VRRGGSQGGRHIRAGDPESKVNENQREQNAAALRVSSSREEILKRIS